MTDLTSVSNNLKSQKSVAIILHVRPDGDAIGSGLALFYALKNIGIDAGVFCDDVIPERFDFILEKGLVKRAIDKDYDCVCFVDCADRYRSGSIYESVKAKKNTVNIDHHVSNDRYAKINYVCDLSSNCENVYNLINEMGVTIDEKIANFLLMGVLTDTGNFQHKNVTDSTLFVAGELVKKGADINKLSYHMFNAQSKARAMLFGKVMSKIRYFLDDRLAMIIVSNSDFASTGAKREETEGFIDFIMGIDTVKVGVCISEMENGTKKVSLRSKGPDVNAVAGTFGGGGHVLASGCQLQGDVEEVVDKLRYVVSQYIDD